MLSQNELRQWVGGIALLNGISSARESTASRHSLELGTALWYGQLGVLWNLFALGVAVAFLSAWAVIALFLRFIGRVGMTPFVLYRIALGSILLILFW